MPQIVINDGEEGVDVRVALNTMFGELYNGGGLPAPAFVFNQPTPAAQWTVNHNLNVNFPVVTVVDLAGQEVQADVLYLSVNQLRINFTSAAAGYARCV